MPWTETKPRSATQCRMRRAVRAALASSMAPTACRVAAGVRPSSCQRFEVFFRRIRLPARRTNPAGCATSATSRCYYLDFLDGGSGPDQVHLVGQSARAGGCPRSRWQLLALATLSPGWTSRIRVKGMPSGDNFIWDAE